MNTKSILTTIFFCLAATSAQAVPAKPGAKRIVRQADGTVVELTLRGDEHFSFYTDDSGAAFKLLPGDKLQPMTAEQVSKTWTKRRQARMIAHPSRTRGVGDPTNAITGKRRGLVILMQFNDLEFVTPEPQQAYNRFFNEPGYHDNGMTGSVKDYFLAQSYGKLEIDFDVVGPYTSKKPMAYYGTNDDNGEDAHAEELIKEAVISASADVDFTNYDWDEDGEVDQVFIIYAGYAESQGAPSETIWPHEYSLKYIGENIVYNGKSIGVYGCSSELMGDGINSIGNMDGIGTACHEFSHCLGLPDMYDTSYMGNYGMANWDVMDSGNYNNNTRTPAGYTSYERWFCGWLEPTELKGDMTQIAGMKPLAESPECYVLYNEGNKNEYYLLENRQNIGFDASLPGHGLLVVHVDFDRKAWVYNTINNDPDHQRMTVIAADNEYRNSSYNSLWGDMFPGSSGNTALTNYSTPASTLYNANADGSYYMNKPIDNITESEDGLISFVAMRPALDIPESAEATQAAGQPSFNITWATVNDAIGYQLELNEKIHEKYADSPSDAVNMDFDLAKTQTDTVGTADISRNLKDYDLDYWYGANLFTSPHKLQIGTSNLIGYVFTAFYDVPLSKDITVELDVEIPDGRTSFMCTTYFRYYNEGDKEKTEDFGGFEVTGSGKYYLYSPSVNFDYFAFGLEPFSQLYLKHLTIYDGIWTADELYNGVPNKGKEVVKTTILDTDTNSITVDCPNPEAQYTYRVRAKDAENHYSMWTAEQSLQLGSSGISHLQIVPSQRAGTIYDLQGRPRGTDPSALPKGIYIIDGKKVVK